MNSQPTLHKKTIHREKFNMLNQDQKFVNEILEKFGLEIKWLAEKIYLEPDLLRYQLREAINYRQDVHSKIVDVFKKEGLVSSNKEVCDKLKDELLDFSTVLTGTVAIITKSIRNKINDQVLNDSEKKDLKEQLRNQLNRVTDEFNDLLITIDLK